MARRPKRIAVADVNVRAIRGPKPDDRQVWYWQAQRSVDGTRETLWSGWATRAEATRIVIDLVALSATKPPPVAPALELPQVTQLATVCDLLETWVGNLQARFGAGDITKYGLRNAKSDGRHLKEHLGDLLVPRLRKADLEAYRNARLHEGAASSTVHRELKALRAAWKWARSDGYVPDRDLPKVRVKVTPVRDKYNPTPEEVWRVVDQLSGWAKFVGGLQAATGARVGEIARLTWDDIHESSSYLVLRGKTGKRLFPITDKVAEVLAWGDRDAHYAHGTTESMVLGHFSSRELVNACAAAGVQRFSSHGFRRAAVDRLQRAGIDIKTAADLLGHSPETMLKYYREVSSEDRRSAATVLSRLGSPREAGAVETSEEVPQTRPPAPSQTPPSAPAQTPHARPSETPENGAPQALRKCKRVTDRGYSPKSPDQRSGKSKGPRTLRASEGLRNGTPKGNRTPVSGVRGQRPNR